MIGCAFQVLDLWNRLQRSSIAILVTVKSVTLWDLWKPTYRRRGQPQWSVQRRLNRTCSFRRWHSSLRLFPDSPKMWPACLVTASGGKNRFYNRQWANQTKVWFGKDTSWGCKTRNVVHMFLKTSCQSQINPQCFHEYVCLVSLQADSREWLSLA